VLRVRREGVPIPRWQQSQCTWVEGRVTVLEERDAQLRRSFLVARLGGPMGQGGDLLPALLEARILLWTAERLILSGFERDCFGKDTAQTWLIMRGSSSPRGNGLLWESSLAEPSQRSQRATESA